MASVESRKIKGGTITTYFVRYTHPSTRKYTSKTFTVKREAEGFAAKVTRYGAAQALAMTEGEATFTTSPTLDEWAAVYIASLTRITPGTRLTYTRLYDRVWAPRLGFYRLPAITYPIVAAALIDYASGEGGKGKTKGLVPRSDKTVANAHGLLAGMMRGALAEDLITKDPCARIKLPRNTTHTKVVPVFLTMAEFGKLHQNLHPHYRPLYAFLVGTGARWGEALALRVHDVDLERTTVSITKSEQANASLDVKDYGPTKTIRSRRTITLPSDVTEALRPLVEGRDPADLLFTAIKGGRISNRRVWGEVWRPAIEKAGLSPAPRMHDLRHTHVAWLISEGVSLPVIQRRLGHESIKTTIDTYGHLMPGDEQAAADAINGFLS